MKSSSKLLLFSHFGAFCAEIQTQFHISIQTLRSDNAKKYFSEPFQSFMLEHGILHQTSCVDTPSQKRVAERKNRHLLEVARDLLFQMHVSKHFWADALSTACFLINRMSSSVLNWATPYHQLFLYNSWFPIDPKVFGYTCFVRDVHPHVFKLDPKSLKCIFVGYSRVHKRYRCYFPTIRRYFESIYVTFFKTTPFPPSSIVTSQGEDGDLLVYTISSPVPTPALVSILVPVKPPINQVYSRHPKPSNL